MFCLYLLSCPKSVPLCPLALKWYRTKGNIQAEVEEMQEEQRSLSSIQTISVWGLLTDCCVRWQVITVAVVNIGMQLSGIDAVSGMAQWPQQLYCLCVGVCSHFRCAENVQLLYQSESSYCYSSQLHSPHLHLFLSIHHSPACSHWMPKQGATGLCLIIFWSSPSLLPHIRRFTHRVKDIIKPIAPCEWRL